MSDWFQNIFNVPSPHKLKCNNENYCINQQIRIYIYLSEDHPTRQGQYKGLVQKGDPYLYDGENNYIIKIYKGIEQKDITIFQLSVIKT